MRFRLPFRRSAIERWAARYPVEDDPRLEGVASAARLQGYLTRAQFLAMAAWKTPRSRPRCERNTDAYVREVTGAALGSPYEGFKINALRLLEGVEWPTASVILHFCDRGRYPILDVRALWSLGIRKAPSYSFPFWMAYTEYLRGVAEKAGVSMRTLDRALWQYSKEKQGS